MIITLYYLLSIISLLVGTAAIYMAMNEEFPLKWLYYHYYIRKPINALILLGQLFMSYNLYWQQGQNPLWIYVPLFLSLFGMVLAIRMHQETVFKAVDYPAMTTSIDPLPLRDEMQIAVIEYDGVTKGYPLDYVIHHHIINDQFNSKTVALTYCAMCRSIIPFDVTDIGPLFVASFKNANMVVGDRKTKTWFQQATFRSELGPLHPHELTMIPFQILPWSEVKKLRQIPPIVNVTEQDLKQFELPIPGIWKMFLASERTPGLSAKRKDHSYPARTPVIGIYDQDVDKELVYLKKDVLKEKLVLNKELGFFLIAVDDGVNAFTTELQDQKLKIAFSDNKIIDQVSGTEWDVRGHYLNGTIQSNLRMVSISDEYWFSWKKYHPDAELILDVFAHKN